MKALLVLATIMATSVAQGQTLLPKGSKGTLRVEFVYSSEGKYLSPSKDQKRDWRARRQVTLTATYVADAPQAMGVLHKDDPKQQSQMAAMQATAMTAQKNLQPTMNDMASIATRCEREAALPNNRQDEAKFEACVTQAVMSYQMSGDQVAKVQSAGQAMNAMQGQMSAQRFQLWKQVTQDGEYSIDETYNKQVYEMTCTDVKVCRRTESRKGGGRIPAPAGKSTAGASFLEVDGEKRDMVLMLPVPLAALNYTQSVTSSISGEPGGTSTGVMPIQWLMKAQQITVTIPGDLRTVSGSRTFPVEGQLEEKGTLTVSWVFTRS